MGERNYVLYDDAEEPEDFILSLTMQVRFLCIFLLKHVIDNETNKRGRMFNMQITRLDEEIMPFVRQRKREYIFGGICGVVTTYFTKVCFFPFCFICIVVFGCIGRMNDA
jgi:low affinity Fe/Cu permease